MACIPAAMAFSRAPYESDSIHDADFFSLIEGSIMQISGLLILTIPTLQDTQLAKQAWFYTWILASLD
jgi:hypothetical protein